MQVPNMMSGLTIGHPLAGARRILLATAMVWITLFSVSTIALPQSDSNSPPAVALTNPPPGSVFSCPAYIRLKATASDADGTIVEVKFYEGTNLLGNVTQPPYQLTLRTDCDVHNVVYCYYASATDDRGATSTSEPVKIFISPDLIRPSVSLTQPSDGEVFLLPASITIATSVKAYDGSEEPVRVFSGTNLLGTADAPSYTLVVSNLAAGQHRLTATYTDDHGNSGTSPEIRITLTPLALRAPGYLPDGRFRFAVTGLSTGRTFLVESAKDPVVWTSLATNFASSNTMEFIDNAATNSTVRFYRARQ